MTLRQWVYRNLYLRSPYWKWLRKKVAQRAGQRCAVRGCEAIGANLDAHHTTYRLSFLGIQFPILFLEWLFLRKMVYLCRFHHNQTHAGYMLILKHGRILEPFGTSWKHLRRQQ